MKTFHLTVRTPEAEVVNTTVTSVKVSTDRGPMVVLPGHASLTGTIPYSRLFVRTEKGEIEYLVRNGIVYVSFKEKGTQILVSACQEMKDVEYTTAKQYLEYVETQLKSGANLNDFQLKFLKDEQIAMVKQVGALELKNG